MPVTWTAGTTADDKPVTLKIRPLIVDGRVREYVLGSPHEITERLFVVRRVFRMNDSLPEDSAPRWQWQRGGWLLVDRTDRPHLAREPAGLRCGVFRRELVSRLRCLLRSLRRWKQAIRHRRRIEPQKAGVEEASFSSPCPTTLRPTPPVPRPSGSDPLSESASKPQALTSKPSPSAAT